MDERLKTVPFPWNVNMAEEAQEAFESVQRDIPYAACQSIGMALAKLEMLEIQGAKVDEEALTFYEAVEMEGKE